jgi:acetyl esterase/lipase
MVREGTFLSLIVLGVWSLGTDSPTSPICVFGGSQASAGNPAGGEILTVQDILALPVPPADYRIPYGSDPFEFGDLRLPAGERPHPVAIVIHGGCWRARYTLEHIGNLAAALARAGIATWSLEYRRLGNAGGGWPGSFEDVGRGADHLRVLAPRFSLDLSRVVVIGHSAGGHLALWLAARPQLPKESPLYSTDPLPLRGVVSLAGVADLNRAVAEGICGDVVRELLGGSPAEVPERYQQASPAELLPLGVPQRLVDGARDQIVPLRLDRAYEAAARERGDDVRLMVVEEAGHFEMIVPGSSAWPAVEGAVRSLVGLQPNEP